jgi:hypothetical protein
MLHVKSISNSNILEIELCHSTMFDAIEMPFYLEPRSALPVVSS